MGRWHPPLDNATFLEHCSRNALPKLDNLRVRVTKLGIATQNRAFWVHFRTEGVGIAVQHNEVEMTPVQHFRRDLASETPIVLIHATPVTE